MQVVRVYTSYMGISKHTPARKKVPNERCVERACKSSYYTSLDRPIRLRAQHVLQSNFETGDLGTICRVIRITRFKESGEYYLLAGVPGIVIYLSICIRRRSLQTQHDIPLRDVPGRKRKPATAKIKKRGRRNEPTAGAKGEAGRQHTLRAREGKGMVRAR